MEYKKKYMFLNGGRLVKFDPDAYEVLKGGSVIHTHLTQYSPEPKQAENGMLVLDCVIHYKTVHEDIGNLIKFVDGIQECIDVGDLVQWGTQYIGVVTDEADRLSLRVNNSQIVSRSEITSVWKPVNDSFVKVVEVSL